MQVIIGTTRRQRLETILASDSSEVRPEIGLPCGWDQTAAQTVGREGCDCEAATDRNKIGEVSGCNRGVLRRFFHDHLG